MEAREKDLFQLKSYIEEVEKEVTMILQSLQWDKKYLLESAPTTACRYDSNHRVPLDTKESHEAKCLLKSCGYTQIDMLLPDPPDEASTLVKLSNEDINKIIENAAISDPSFKKGAGTEDVAPLTVERLQSTYTADERRAIHDAVVNVAPTICNVSDLVLPGSDDATPRREKSRVEVLAELRDMKRRRTKYRTTARTSNYSDALRDVIKIQMDLYCEALGVIQHDDENKPESRINDNNHGNTQNQECDTASTKNNSRYRIHSKTTKHTYSDDKYARNIKEIVSEHAKHKHQESRREHYDNRYRNKRHTGNFEDGKRHDDFKHKHHQKQHREEHRHSKLESYEYRLDREIKKEPEEYSIGHSSKNHEEKSNEQSRYKYGNDSKYKDRHRLYNKEYSRDYDSERNEQSSRRYKHCDRRRSQDYEYHERKRKFSNDRAREDSYIQYNIKQEKCEESAYEDNSKHK